MHDPLKDLTIETLLWWLPIVENNGWKEHRDEAIRDDKGRCPICALADEILGKETGYVETFWAAMNLATGRSNCATLPELREVADAADWSNNIRRRALKQALGLQ